MPVDWKAEISRVAYWKQLIADHDKAGALPWHLPRNGATPDEIRLAEQAIGIDFPVELKQFLTYANGWRAFYILTDLFGTCEYLSDMPKNIMLRDDVKAFIKKKDLPQGEVFAIGASELELDVFLIVSSSRNILQGKVFWIAGEEIDSYKSFSEFFSSMVNYNARIATKTLQGTA